MAAKTPLPSPSTSSPRWCWCLIPATAIIKRSAFPEGTPPRASLAQIRPGSPSHGTTTRSPGMQTRLHTSSTAKPVPIFTSRSNAKKERLPKGSLFFDRGTKTRLAQLVSAASTDEHGQRVALIHGANGRSSTSCIHEAGQSERLTIVEAGDGHLITNLQSA